MDNVSKDSWFVRLLSKVKGGEEGEKRLGTYPKLLILAGLGVAVMIFSSFGTGPKSAGQQEIRGPNKDQPAFMSKDKSSDASMDDYASAYEQQLKKILEEVVGIGEVSVMVNLESSEEVVVEKDVNTKNQTTREMDKEKATRDVTDNTRDEKVVLVSEGQGQHPIVLKKLAPKVNGVLIVAKGADNLKVKAAILDAVEKVLHVEPHKISIQPKK
jgi:stage III sporulation protein AG